METQNIPAHNNWLYQHKIKNGKIIREAEAKLGQAQLKLGLGFTSINLHNIHNQEISLARSTAINH